ncbi:hypothetical protein BU17DRAFT_61111 [Hysterangium stoloniferum]|nr:hypothetical protein BU17DRAFT_61111 [Hysterangium stoloniferum]
MNPTIHHTTGTRVSRDYYPLAHHQAYFDEYEASDMLSATGFFLVHTAGKAPPPGDGYNLTNLKDGKPSRKGGLPPHGHRFVIACTIYGAPEEKLTLSELYLALKRCVHHALSRYEAFQRVNSVRDGKHQTSWWKWSPGFGPLDIMLGGRAGKHKYAKRKEPKPVEAEVTASTSVVSRGRNPKRTSGIIARRSVTFTAYLTRLADAEERRVPRATEERHAHRFAPYPQSPHAAGTSRHTIDSGGKTAVHTASSTNDQPTLPPIAIRPTTYCRISTSYASNLRSLFSTWSDQLGCVKMGREQRNMNLYEIRNPTTSSHGLSPPPPTATSQTATSSSRASTPPVTDSRAVQLLELIVKAEKEAEEKRKAWLWKVMEDWKLREEVEKKQQDAEVAEKRVREIREGKLRRWKWRERLGLRVQK